MVCRSGGTVKGKAENKLELKPHSCHTLYSNKLHSCTVFLWNIRLFYISSSSWCPSLFCSISPQHNALLFFNFVFAFSSSFSFLMLCCTSTQASLCCHWAMLLSSTAKAKKIHIQWLYLKGDTSCPSPFQTLYPSRLWGPASKSSAVSPFSHI